MFFFYTELRTALNCTSKIYLDTCSGCNNCFEEEDERQQSVRAGMSQEAGTTKLTVAVPSDWDNCFVMLLRLLRLSRVL